MLFSDIIITDTHLTEPRESIGVYTAFLGVKNGMRQISYHVFHQDVVLYGTRNFIMHIELRHFLR